MHSKICCLDKRLTTHYDGYTITSFPMREQYLKSAISLNMLPGGASVRESASIDPPVFPMPLTNKNIALWLIESLIHN